jgi:hypothetical protein
VRSFEHDVSLKAWFSISVYLINQTLGGPLVRALRARAGTLLLICSLRNE